MNERKFSIPDIPRTIKEFRDNEKLKCSICNRKDIQEHFKFCPMCGSMIDWHEWKNQVVMLYVD